MTLTQMRNLLTVDPAELLHEVTSKMNLKVTLSYISANYDVITPCKVAELHLRRVANTLAIALLRWESEICMRRETYLEIVG